MKSKNEQTGLDAKYLLHVLTAVDEGDFSKRLPDYYNGVEGEIANTLNSIIRKNALLNQELKRLNEMSGASCSDKLFHESEETSGCFYTTPMVLDRASGTWRDLPDDICFIGVTHT